MTVQQLLDLGEYEQQVVLSEYGKVLITYLQGDLVISIYSLNDLFIKISKGENSAQKFEAFNELSNLKLYQCGQTDS